jgi:hypothetical protein
MDNSRRDRKPRQPATRWHIFFAVAVVFWLIGIAAMLAWALFMRLEGCAQHPIPDSSLNIVCNFRGLGTTLLATYLGLVFVLIWHTSKYDPEVIDPSSRKRFRSPLAIYKGSYRALRVQDTPLTKTHRFGFWTLLITVAGFIYLVEVSEFIFL